MTTTKRNQQTRERILVSADRLFRQFSYLGLRMKILADHMGLSRKTLYNHFPGGKREIWKSCIERQMREFAARLFLIVDDTDGDYVERGGDILKIGREVVAIFYGPEGLISSGEDLNLFFSELKPRYVEALTCFFGEGVRKGLLRNDLPIRSLSEVMVTLIVVWGRRDSTLMEGEVKSLSEFVETVMFTGILSEEGRRQSHRLVRGE